MPPLPDTWTSEALQQELKVTDAGTIRNALYFWNNLGVLGGMADDMWRLLEERAAPLASTGPAPVHGEPCGVQGRLAKMLTGSRSRSHGRGEGGCPKRRRQAGRGGAFR